MVTRGPLNVHPAKLRELLERGLPAEESHERGDSTSTGTGNREVLPALLDHYGLYPWRVQLIAEGESDLAMLEEVLAARYDLSFGYLSIHAFALGGADIQANAELILGAVRVYSMPPPDASTHSPPISSRCYSRSIVVIRFSSYSARGHLTSASITPARRPAFSWCSLQRSM